MRRFFLPCLLLLSIPLFLITACSDDEGTDNAATYDMVLVPSGTFTMGASGQTSQPNERPPHSISIDAFYMTKLEISQALYEEVMGSNPSNNKGRNKPVVKVTWYDALHFCNALSERDGLEPVYSDIDDNVHADFNANGYRLPTEAEWEYACRSGTNSTYYSGESVADLGRCAWFSGNSNGEVHERGLLEPNNFGLYDMHGNVFEWCWDWYQASYYLESEQNNPRGPVGGDEKICRGGSWFVWEYGCRAAFRSMLARDLSGIDIGFRIVRNAE